MSDGPTGTRVSHIAYALLRLDRMIYGEDRLGNGRGYGDPVSARRWRALGACRTVRAARRSLTRLGPWGLAGVSPDDYDANVRSTKPTGEMDHSSPVPPPEAGAAAIQRPTAE